MQRNVANTVIACVAFIALLLGLLVHRVLSPTIMTHDQLSDLGLFVYDVPRRFNDFKLVDQDGKPFTQDWLKGHWSLVFFGYTYCPDVCPTTMASIRQFQDKLAKVDEKAAASLQVAMVSVDPRRDTPEKMGAYVSYFGKDYKGVTGEYIDIFNLARQLNIAFGYQADGNGGYTVNHSGEIPLIDPEGHFHGFFKANPDPEKMVATFRSVFSTWQNR